MMKKVLYTLGLLACTSVAAHAQTSALKLNLFSLAASTGSVFFEHKTSDTNTFQIGAFYTGYSTSGTKISGFGITPEYRFYVTGEAMQGFYLGPFLRYQNFTLTDEDVFFGSGTKNEATLNTFGGGVNLGYQWVFKQHIVLEPFLRVGYSAGSIKNTSGNGSYDISGSINGFGLLPGLNLGYAF